LSWPEFDVGDLEQMVSNIRDMCLRSRALCDLFVLLAFIAVRRRWSRFRRYRPMTSDASTRSLRNHVILPSPTKKHFSCTHVALDCTSRLSRNRRRGKTLQAENYSKHRQVGLIGRATAVARDPTFFDSRSARIKFPTLHSTDGDFGASTKPLMYCHCRFMRMLR